MTAEQIAEKLTTATTRRAATDLVATLRGRQLQAVADAAKVDLRPARTVAEKRDLLVQRTVGFRLNSAAVRAL